MASPIPRGWVDTDASQEERRKYWEAKRKAQRIIDGEYEVVEDDQRLLTDESKRRDDGR